MLDFRIFGNPMEVEKEEERDHALPCRRGESLGEGWGWRRKQLYFNSLFRGPQ